MGLARNALAGKNRSRRGTGLPIFFSGFIPMFTAKLERESMHQAWELLTRNALLWFELNTIGFW
jgi:hypothetical protein